MLAASLRQECLVDLVPPCLGQLHMRYPDSLQRQEGFRSPSRRLVCVNSAIHTGRPPLGFCMPGKESYQLPPGLKGRVSRVHCSLSNLHRWWLWLHILASFKGTATQGLNYTGFQKSSEAQQSQFYLNVNLQEEINILFLFLKSFYPKSCMQALSTALTHYDPFIL